MLRSFNRSKRILRRVDAKGRVWKSGLEQKIADQIEAAGLEVKYETTKLAYVKPATPTAYAVDFDLPGFHIETKGRFEAADRKKHLLVKEQHPERDIRFVFSNSSSKINKGSKTTYADWCNKHGFKYADKSIPPEWIVEAGKNHKSGRFRSNQKV